MIVVDASVLFEVLVGSSRGEPMRARLLDDGDPVAPHLIDVEVTAVVRAHLAAGKLDRTSAAQAIDELSDWPGERYGHQLLLRRAFQLRENLRTPDAVYVALAEALEVPLVTLDRRLANATGFACSVELLG